MFLCFLERERDREDAHELGSGRPQGRRKGKEKFKQALSMPKAEPDTGLDSQS